VKNDGSSFGPGYGGVAWSYQGINIAAGSSVMFKFYVGEGSNSLSAELSSLVTSGGGRGPLATTASWDGDTSQTSVVTTKGWVDFEFSVYTGWWAVNAQAYTIGTTNVASGVTITASAGDLEEGMLPVTLTDENEGSVAKTVDVAVWGDADIGSEGALGANPDYKTNWFSKVTNGIKVRYSSASGPEFYVMFAGSGLNGVPSTIWLGDYEYLDDAANHLDSSEQPSFTGDGGIAFSFKEMDLPASSSKTIKFYVVGGEEDDEETSTSPKPKEPINVAAVVGGVVGGVVLIAVVVTVVLCLYRKNLGPAGVGDDQQPGAAAYQPTPGAQPVQQGYPQQPQQWGQGYPQQPVQQGQ
jgi:hypothetical protein